MQALSPSPRTGRCIRRESGQATVELVGSLPALLLLATVLMQLLVVGYTAVLAGNAAEAGALAVARGGAGGVLRGGGASSAARAAVPGWARARLQVASGRGAVRVRMRAPALLPGVSSLLHVNATAAVAAPGRVPVLGLPLP